MINSISKTIAYEIQFLTRINLFLHSEFLLITNRNDVQLTQVFFHSIVSMLPNKAPMFLRLYQLVIWVQAAFC